jgi:hypothetical protein
MKRFISFGSIEQFRTVVKNVQWMSQYKGKDDEGNPIIDRAAKAPKIKAVGTEKIHGTNAAVCYSHPDGMWVQSRKNIITPEKDNAGCAFAVESKSIEWMKIIDTLINEYGIDCHKNIISVYFEWCGGNIQKNACVSGLDKMAIIFKHFKVSPIEPQTGEDGQETAAKWYETMIAGNTIPGYIQWLENPEANIFNVHNFPVLEIEIDFENPGEAQNEMIRLTEEVEKNSGIAKHFNKPENIGEGWVWTFQDERGNIQRWKTKGEEHSKGSGKVKTLKPIDTEFEKKKAKFVNEFACREFRLDQMYTEIVNGTYNGDGTKMSMRDMGDYLRLVIKDVIKEESEAMAEMGLEPKPLNSMISKVARGYFQSRLDKETGF